MRPGEYNSLKARVSDLEEWIEENRPYLSREAVKKLEARIKSMIGHQDYLEERLARIERRLHEIEQANKKKKPAKKDGNVFYKDPAEEDPLRIEMADPDALRATLEALGVNRPNGDHYYLYQPDSPSDAGETS